MNDEIRFLRHGINLVDRRLQSRSDIRICRLVEADVTVTDLEKTEVRTFARIFIGTFAAAFSECSRHRDATTHGPDQARARPCHTLQESAAINAIIVEVL